MHEIAVCFLLQSCKTKNFAEICNWLFVHDWHENLGGTGARADKTEDEHVFSRWSPRGTGDRRPVALPLAIRLSEYEPYRPSIVDGKPSRPFSMTIFKKNLAQVTKASFAICAGRPRQGHFFKLSFRCFAFKGYVLTWFPQQVAQTLFSKPPLKCFFQTLVPPPISRTMPG